MEYDDIKNTINKILLMQENIVIFIKDEIDNIIENNIIDDKRIEKLFDQLINLFQTEEVFNLFKKLSNYYYKINKQLVRDYCNFYKDLYLEDSLKILKK